MEASGSGGGGLSDNLQKALDDLRSAGEKATGDVRARIDDAVQRLNDASSQATSRAQDATSKAQDQVGGWRETLDKATEDVRLQLAKLAIKAQTTPEALNEIESEISARRGEIG